MIQQKTLCPSFADQLCNEIQFRNYVFDNEFVFTFVIPMIMNEILMFDYISAVCQIIW